MDNLHDNVFQDFCNNIIIPEKSEKFTQDEVLFEHEKQRYRIKLCPEEKTVSLSKYVNHAWFSLSSWLFDEENITKKDLAFISEDFKQVLKNSKKQQSAEIKNIANKGGKPRTSTDGLMFFINRLATFVPSLRADIKNEKESSENFRFVYFLDTYALPKLREFLLNSDEKTKFKFFKSLSEQYSNGNLNVRSFVTMGVLNNLDFELYEKFCPNEDFKNTWKQSLKYKR